MVQLPSQNLPAGQALVIANNKTVFMSRYPAVPGGQVIEMNSLAAYPAWASGKISLQNTNGGNPFRESIALLGPDDTIVDLVQYTTPIKASGLDPDNKPIVLQSPSVSPNTSYDRCPALRDTNNSESDFYAHTELAPGYTSRGVAAWPLERSSWPTRS